MKRTGFFILLLFGGSLRAEEKPAHAQYFALTTGNPAQGISAVGYAPLASLAPSTTVEGVWIAVDGPGCPKRTADLLLRVEAPRGYTVEAMAEDARRFLAPPPPWIRAALDREKVDRTRCPKVRFAHFNTIAPVPLFHYGTARPIVVRESYRDGSDGRCDVAVLRRGVVRSNFSRLSPGEKPFQCPVMTYVKLACRSGDGKPYQKSLACSGFGGIDECVRQAKEDFADRADRESAEPIGDGAFRATFGKLSQEEIPYVRERCAGLSVCAFPRAQEGTVACLAAEDGSCPAVRDCADRQRESKVDIHFDTVVSSIRERDDDARSPVYQTLEFQERADRKEKVLRRKETVSPGSHR